MDHVKENEETEPDAGPEMKPGSGTKPGAAPGPEPKPGSGTKPWAAPGPESESKSGPDKEADPRVLERYGDILDLPHHESDHHPHLSKEQRAAQFSPFAALTGYGDVIHETARENEERMEKNGGRE